MSKPLSMLAALTVIPIATTAWADPESGGYYHGHMWDGGFGMGLFGISMMVLFWGVIIALAVFAVRALTGQSHGSQRNTAMDTLKERLAKGDIDPEEFEARRKVLEA